MLSSRIRIAICNFILAYVLPFIFYMIHGQPPTSKTKNKKCHTMNEITLSEKCSYQKYYSSNRVVVCYPCTVLYIHIRIIILSFGFHPSSLWFYIHELWRLKMPHLWHFTTCPFWMYVRLNDRCQYFAINQHRNDQQRNSNWDRFPSHF